MTGYPSRHSFRKLWDVPMKETNQRYFGVPPKFRKALNWGFRPNDGEGHMDSPWLLAIETICGEIHGQMWLLNWGVGIDVLMFHITLRFIGDILHLQQIWLLLKVMWVPNQQKGTSIPSPGECPRLWPTSGIGICPSRWCFGIPFGDLGCRFHTQNEISIL